MTQSGLYEVFIEGAKDTSAAGKERLAQALNRSYGLPLDQSRRVVAGGRFRVKRDVPLETARRYLAHLESLGARVSIVESTARTSASSPDLRAAARAAQAGQAAAQSAAAQSAAPGQSAPEASPSHRQAHARVTPAAEAMGGSALAPAAAQTPAAAHAPRTRAGDRDAISIQGLVGGLGGGMASASQGPGGAAPMPDSPPGDPAAGPRHGAPTPGTPTPPPGGPDALPLVTLDRAFAPPGGGAPIPLDDSAFAPPGGGATATRTDRSAPPPRTTAPTGPGPGHEATAAKTAGIASASAPTGSPLDEFAPPDENEPALELAIERPSRQTAAASGSPGPEARQQAAVPDAGPASPVPRDASRTPEKKPLPVFGLDEAPPPPGAVLQAAAPLASRAPEPGRPAARPARTTGEASTRPQAARDAAAAPAGGILGGRIRQNLAARVLLGVALSVAFAFIPASMYASRVHATTIRALQEEERELRERPAAAGQTRTPQAVREEIGAVRTRAFFVTLVMWVFMAAVLGFLWFRYV